MKQVRIVGVGRTGIGRLNQNSTALAIDALRLAAESAGFSDPRKELHGLIAVPSLAQPHFMQAHYLATAAGLFPHNRLILRTLDTGGAGPVSALSVAVQMIRQEWCETVAVVASDAVLSLPNDEFARRSDDSVRGSNLPSPSIPYGYDRVAQWHMQKHGVTREQLAMVPVLLSHMASRHPDAMCRTPYTLAQVLSSRPIAPVTSLLECARRADGAVALIISSARHFSRHYSKPLSACPVIISTGEASGPLFPPAEPSDMADMFSCERACDFAFEQAQLGPRDIDFFGLYDCFPICFLRALEAAGVCAEGQAGVFVEGTYRRLVQGGGDIASLRGLMVAGRKRDSFPINTHGGLLCFGAPWEVPAMYNVTEAVEQLLGTAGGRQITPKPHRALVYGNGGIFSASSVAILGDGVYAS